jgi:hypothetical protein
MLRQANGFVPVHQLSTHAIMNKTALAPSATRGGGGLSRSIVRRRSQAQPVNYSTPIHRQRRTQHSPDRSSGRTLMGSLASRRQHPLCQSEPGVPSCVARSLQQPWQRQWQADCRLHVIAPLPKSDWQTASTTPCRATTTTALHVFSIAMRDPWRTTSTVTAIRPSPIIAFLDIRQPCICLLCMQLLCMRHP